MPSDGDAHEVTLSGACPSAPWRRRRAPTGTRRQLRESTHDSLAAPPVTARAARMGAHWACAAARRGDEGASGGAVVVRGWLVRGDLLDCIR